MYSGENEVVLNIRKLFKEIEGFEEQLQITNYTLGIEWANTRPYGRNRIEQMIYDKLINYITYGFSIKCNQISNEIYKIKKERNTFNI